MEDERTISLLLSSQINDTSIILGTLLILQIAISSCPWVLDSAVSAACSLKPGELTSGACRKNMYEHHKNTRAVHMSWNVIE